MQYACSACIRVNNEGMTCSTILTFLFSCAGHSIYTAADQGLRMLYIMAIPIKDSAMLLLATYRSLLHAPWAGLPQ